VRHFSRTIGTRATEQEPGQPNRMHVQAASVRHPRRALTGSGTGDGDRAAGSCTSPYIVRGFLPHQLSHDRSSTRHAPSTPQPCDRIRPASDAARSRREARHVPMTRASPIRQVKPYVPGPRPPGTGPPHCPQKGPQSRVGACIARPAHILTAQSGEGEVLRSPVASLRRRRRLRARGHGLRGPRRPCSGTSASHRSHSTRWTRRLSRSEPSAPQRSQMPSLRSAKASVTARRRACSASVQLPPGFHARGYAWKARDPHLCFTARSSYVGNSATTA
jgi:hypothetical protein